jgi:RimJ/RimL family protein N-acetyltransferase
LVDFGAGVSLGPVNQEHQDKLNGWRNLYDIRKWCRQRSLISNFDQQNWFLSMSKDPHIEMFIIHKGQDEVGVCGLTDIDKWNNRAEFSLYIGTEFQRMGYAKAALKTLLLHGFKNLGLNIVWGETFTGNPAYQMFLDLGMKHEGSRRDFYFKDGKFIDAHLVSIKNSDLEGLSWTWSLLQR